MLKRDAGPRLSRRSIIVGAVATTAFTLSERRAQAWPAHGTPAASAGNAPFVIPGSITSSGTTSDPTAAWAYDTYGTPEGTVLQEGYNYAPAGVNWACERFQDSIDGDIWIGLVGAGTPDLASYMAGDIFCNMKKFSVAIGGGSYADITTPMAHPVTGKIAYWCRVRASDLPGGAASGLYEVRARAISKVGQPYLLQGADPASAAVLAWQSTFSNYVVLDKGDLARQTIYKAPNDSTADTSDTHAGTAGDPCVTWKRARDLQRAHASYPSVLTTILLTNGLNHDWGLQSGVDDPPVESTIGWTKIAPAPGATVAITVWRGPSAQSAVPNTLKASSNGRMPWRSFYLKGVDIGDVTIDNTYFTVGTADGYYNNVGRGLNTSFHAHLENITTTTRATTLGTTGTMNGQPLNGDWFNHGDHCLAVEYVNCQIGYAATSNFYQTTYGRDCTLTHIANYGDVMDNSRYFAGLRCFSIIEGAMGNHLDLAQPTVTPAPNPPAWLEDLIWTTDDGVAGQGVLGDSGHIYHNSVFVRFRCRSGTAHDISFASGQRNNRWIYPNTTGAGNVVGPNYNAFGTSAALAAPQDNVWYAYDATGLGASAQETYYRRGVKHLYPFTTTSPNPGQVIPTSSIAGQIGSGNTIVSLLDADVQEFAQRIHHDDSWPPTFYQSGTVKVRGIEDANQPERATLGNIVGSSAGVSTFASGTKADLMGQATDANRPLAVEGAHRAIRFDQTLNQYLLGKIYTLARLSGHINDGSTAPAVTGNVLTVSEVNQGAPLAVGMAVTDFGSNTLTITSQITGAPGGAGTYQLSGNAYVGATSPGGNVPAGQVTDVALSAIYPGQTTALGQSTQAMTIFMALPNVANAADATQRFFWHAGRAGTGVSYIGIQKQAGWSAPRMIFNSAKTNGTPAGVTGDTGTAGPAVTGPAVVGLEIMSDRLRFTYWNANTAVAPNTGDGGYQTDITFGAGYTPWHLVACEQNMALAGSSVEPGTTNYASMDFNALLIAFQLDSISRANVLAVMKARVGLS